MSGFPSGKQLAVVHVVPVNSEIEEIFNRVRTAALSFNLNPLIVFFITIGEWSAIIVKLQGDNWIDLAKFKHNSRHDNYTRLPEVILSDDFKTLSNWIKSGEGTTGKKVVYLTPYWKSTPTKKGPIWTPSK